MITVCVTDNEQPGMSAGCCCVCGEVVQRGAWSQWSIGSAVSTDSATESAPHYAAHG